MAKVDFKLSLYPLQKEIDESIDVADAFLYLLVIGRQAGKSYLCRYLSLKHAITKNKTVLWVSPSADSSDSHWNSLVNLITKSGLPCTIRQSNKTISFKGGGSIIVRSALSEDKIRGFSIDLMILDEAAYYYQGEYLFFSVLLPMISATNGKIVIATTPNGHNWVYDLYNTAIEGSEPYKAWRAPSSVSPFQNKKLLATFKRVMPRRQYREEILAEFITDTGGVFSEIETATVLPMRQPYEIPNGGLPFVMGVDVAGGGRDFSVITIIDPNTREQVFGERMNESGQNILLRRIIQLIIMWRVGALVMESNGVSTYVAKTLESVINGTMAEDMLVVLGLDDPIRRGNFRSLPLILRALNITAKQKSEFVERLAGALEFGVLKLLSENQDGEDAADFARTQVRELGAYERKRASNRLYPTYSGASGFNDDTVSALYLAYSEIPDPAYFVDVEDTVGENPFRNANSTRRKFRGATRLDFI